VPPTSIADGYESSWLLVGGGFNFPMVPRRRIGLLDSAAACSRPLPPAILLLLRRHSDSGGPNRRWVRCFHSLGRFFSSSFEARRPLIEEVSGFSPEDFFRHTASRWLWVSGRLALSLPGWLPAAPSACLHRLIYGQRAAWWRTLLARRLGCSG